MRILILGGGGREHAIGSALARQGRELLFAPGNGGTASLGENIPLDAEVPELVAEEAVRRGVDFVVVGPEAPLVAGVADVLEQEGIATFGPGAMAAQVEGSKRFAKDLMQRHGIPTGAHATFTDEGSALAYLDEVGAPIVVKADGLAAGKGVTVAHDIETAREAVRECFAGRFGDAGSTVVIEEMLVGQECSLLAFTDGKTVLPMIPAQDHKPVFDGDRGPNTGGMGVYTPVPVVTDEALATMEAVLAETVSALAEEGVHYKGVLYGGFILTDDGPKVLEFNARFGDPETQVILPMLETDLLEVLVAVAEERLEEVELRWSDGACLSVVMASPGYPGSYPKGLPIEGIEDAEAVDGVTVFHAGTAIEDGRLVTSGGRVLNVTAKAADLATAKQVAYEAVSKIKFEGAHFRTDIGAKALSYQP
ncbi:MAG: phosphoribosylamine--glycine ligase [Coriobacteriia bacterium]